MKSPYSLMLIIKILLILAIPTQASAINFDVIGPCSSSPVHAGAFKTDLSDSVGKITVDILDFYEIPYLGNESGMNSILNTPVGLEAIEVISDTKMRAYGWCFSVNGEIPDALAGESFFAKQNDYLSWFFAYSTYDQGVWTDYCVPAFKIKSPQFCK